MGTLVRTPWGVLAIHVKKSRIGAEHRGATAKRYVDVLLRASTFSFCFLHRPSYSTTTNI
ncbi:hypothetical protein LX36DRAFT_656404 [Colletotrichum falcatum]|nr:hypothetical protein LX36DRAFT_656404 [Colletotrichum falcatum]